MDATGDDGDDMHAFVMALKARCTAIRSQAETDELLARAEQDQRDRDARAARIRLIEEERDRNAQREARRKRERELRKRMLEQGMVEVQVDPGKPWNRHWLGDVVWALVPELTKGGLPKHFGTEAILYGLDRLRNREAMGRPITNRAAYVVDQANRVMAGKQRMWVTRDEALKKPHLIIPSSWGYGGSTDDDD